MTARVNRRLKPVHADAYSVGSLVTVTDPNGDRHQAIEAVEATGRRVYVHVTPRQAAYLGRTLVDFGKAEDTLPAAMAVTLAANLLRHAAKVNGVTQPDSAVSLALSNAIRRYTNTAESSGGAQ